MKFYILFGFEDMIPWEKVINNDVLGTLPDSEFVVSFFFFLFSFVRKGINSRNYKEQK